MSRDLLAASAARLTEVALRARHADVFRILRRAVASEEELVEPLGKRFFLLFGGIGLEEDVPELGGRPFDRLISADLPFL